MMTNLEQTLRAHPLVAPRLAHKRDMNAAEAAVQECIHGTPVPDFWKRTATVQQVKMAYSQLVDEKRLVSNASGR